MSDLWGWGGVRLVVGWLACGALTQGCETTVMHASNGDSKPRTSTASATGSKAGASALAGAMAGAMAAAGAGARAGSSAAGRSAQAGAGSAGRAVGLAAGSGGVAAGSGDVAAGSSDVAAGSGGVAAGSGGVAAGSGMVSAGASGGAGESAGVAGMPAAGGGGASAGRPAAGSGGTDSGGAGAAGAGVLPSGDYTYLSDSDKSAGVTVSADHLAGEWSGLGTWGVRSTRAVAPGSGVYYAELSADAEVDYFALGVATAAASLERPAGATSEGFSVDVSGFFVVQNQIADFERLSNDYGFVVDYRGAFPTLYVISGKPGEAAKLLRRQQLDAISAPLFLHLNGMRRVPRLQASINPGNDTANRPFKFDPANALRADGLADVADALVLGWGATHAAAFNQPPKLTLTSQRAITINQGQSVTLMASASDVEEGAIDARIQWDVLSMGNGPERVRGSGASFTFTPNAIGKHPVQVSIGDQLGKQAKESIEVTVHGTLPQLSDVRLVKEGNTGDGAAISPDGLKAYWSLDHKIGVRANQGLYGGFWYVEAHRLVDPTNQAIGLVIGHVSLNPYSFDVTPPSCSVNTQQPGVYKDLITVHEFSEGAAIAYYGLAVDYRAERPTVYVIMNGRVASTLILEDVTVPIYPMLYGNVTGGAEPWDIEINFGGSAFHEDPKAALSAAGIDASALQLCWGNANAACVH